jgi:hypothetical protein
MGFITEAQGCFNLKINAIIYNKTWKQAHDPLNQYRKKHLTKMNIHSLCITLSELRLNEASLIWKKASIKNFQKRKRNAISICWSCLLAYKPTTRINECRELYIYYIHANIYFFNMSNTIVSLNGSRCYLVN